MTSTYLLAVAFFTSIALPTSYSTSSLRCPDELLAEEGSIQVVNCSLTTSTLLELYWYVGTSTSSLPIAQLVYGVQHVWPVQHYDISDDGSLIIKSVGRNQTGHYTILHFMEDDETEQDTVLVTLIEPCPVIDQCTSCEDCVIQTSEDVIFLTCTITSTTTEKISPIWTYNNGSIIQGRIHEERLSDNSWNASVSLDIESLNCGLTVFLCSSSVGGHENALRDARVNVTFVSCDDLEIPNDGNAPILIVACVIAIVIIVTTTLLISLYCGGRCKRNTKNENGNEDEDEDLKEIDPLIDRFLEIQLKIETPNGERKEMSAATFFDSDEWKNTNRILFVGEFFTKETPIIKQANLICSRGNIDETLFVVVMEKPDFEADITKEIYEQLPPNSEYSLEEINDMLCGGKCLVIFDGGGELLEPPKHLDSEEVINLDGLTIFDMLCKSKSEFLRVWVTSIPSVPSNHFSHYTKIYLQELKEHGSQSSITNF